MNRLKIAIQLFLTVAMFVAAYRMKEHSYYSHISQRPALLVCSSKYRTMNAEVCCLLEMDDGVIPVKANAKYQTFKLVWE